MSYQSDNLYIRDNKGRTRIWSVKTIGGIVTVSHGLLEGKLTFKSTEAKPKNAGKANATTAEQQAVLEAKSKYTKQVEREDYNTDVDKSGLQFRPMLALDYLKVGHRVKWDEVLTQPKLDGLRLSSGYRTPCSDTFELMTRKGENYNIPHLKTPAKALLSSVNNLLDTGHTCQVLDGEAYVHGWPLQKIVKAAKKYRESLTPFLEYHIFDLCIPGLTFDERASILSHAHS